jgi:N,N'-diacetyllegionaminate synthase
MDISTLGNNSNDQCFIVAEIGVNHNGDMDLAKKAIIAARECGADAIKFQNYKVDDFIVDRELEYTYFSNNKKVVETQYEMFKRYELSDEQVVELKAFSDTNGIVFLSTPTSLHGINILKSLNVPLLKNGSDFLVNLELIADMAKSQIPTIISTGMATLSEIDEAVQTFEENGGKELIILHCTSAYPTPSDQVNLNKIDSLQSAFGYPVGFSDHTQGSVAAIGAVIKGACFIEKHFTLDKSLSGPDHHFSSDPAELKKLIQDIRTIEASLGSSKLAPTKIEQQGRKNYRLSCVAKNKLAINQLITREDIIFSRPASGLSPKYLPLLIGKHVKKEIQANKPILFEHIL